MKPLYKKYETRKADATLLFNLVALLATIERDVQAEDLDRLCVRLVRPRISGALLLTAKSFAGNYVTANDNEVSVHLSTLPEGKNRVTVEAEFGTNTVVLAIVDIFTTADESGVFEPEAITTPVVKQTGDETGVTPAELAAAVAEIEQEMAGKADGQVYRVGESGDPAVRDVAKIYGHGLEVGQNAQATGLHAVAVGDAKATGESSFAHGYTYGTDSYIEAGSDGAQAHGYTYGTDSYIEAGSDGAQAHGRTDGDGSYIQAGSDGAQAHGRTYGTDSYIQAGGSGAQAHGRTYGTDSYIEAGGSGAQAHGYTDGDGSYIEAGGDGAQAHGCTYGTDSYIEAGGSGAQAHGCTYGTDSYIEAGSDGAQAHGYTDGTDSYIEAGGSGAQAHGCTDGDGSYIQAGDWGAHASGVANTNQGGHGNIEATSEASFAHGKGVKAKSDSQFVIGRANMVDDQDTYAFIVGNGTDDDHRSNAFAIDWDGNLVLFNNGTPVVLTPAKLAQLIA